MAVAEADVPAAFPSARDILSEHDLRRAVFWLNELGKEWRAEIPMRIHERGAYGLGSAPPFTTEFMNYLRGKTRTNKAFRRLRRVSPREFDAVYMYCILQYHPRDIAKFLTDRAIRLDKPERYDVNAVWLLLLGGIDKVQKWW